MAPAPLLNCCVPFKKDITRWATKLGIGLYVGLSLDDGGSNDLPDGVPSFLIPEIRRIQRTGVLVGKQIM